MERKMNLKGGVIFVVGINGVGKSTTSLFLRDCLGEATVICAADLLSSLFGGVSREELMNLPAKKKMSVMVPEFVRVLKEHKTTGTNTLIFDTHLLVPVFSSGARKIEKVWDPRYAQLTDVVFYLNAKPLTIWWRRLKAQHKTGRKRDLSLRRIMLHQQLNTCLFVQEVKPYVRGVIIETDRGTIKAAGKMLSHII